MSVPDRTYAQGDPWRPNAAQFNFWTAGGRRAQQGDLPSSAPSIGPQLGTLVTVVNDTVDPLPHLACVAFRDPQFTAEENEALFTNGIPLKCRLPIDDSSYRHGILTEALRPGQSGLALLSGVIACRVTGAAATHAAPVPDDHVLAVGSTGWPLLWKESGSAERWGLVEVGGVAAQGCVPVYYLRTGIGNITGSFVWQLLLISDRSVVVSGTFTIGTSSVATIKTAIDTAVGGDFDLLASGSLPGTIELHPNRGMSNPLYEIIVTTQTLTPAESGYPAFVYAEPCCVVGG